MHIIRKTKSVCPECLSFIDSYVIEREGRIFFSKTCGQHGRYEIVLSRAAHYYIKLEKFYFTIMNKDKKVREYEIWPSLRCNMDCSICCLGDERNSSEYSEPTQTDIETFIKTCRQNFFILSGGEPTCRNDLDEIIRVMRKYNKVVTMNTNGIKLADLEYLNKLRGAGLDRVNFQFDGFNRESYLILRNADLLDIKLRILGNLKSLNIPTVLNATIARNVNEDAIFDLIKFSASNYFINAVNFFTICAIGEARDWPLNDYIMPDEVIDILEEKTNHEINRKNIYIFQKLHLAVKSFLSQRYCFYNQIYVFVRHNDSLEPIDKFLNLDFADIFLRLYESVYNKNRFLSKFVLVGAIIGSLLNSNSFIILKEFLAMSCSYFFKTKQYLKTSSFFYVSFATGCDPYKIDYSIVGNCQNEIIGFDIGSGELRHKGRDGLYCIDLERKHLFNRQRS